MDATSVKTLDKQWVNDIEKAQAQAMYKLSRVIGCEIEDLLERSMDQNGSSMLISLRIDILSGDI